MAKKKNRNIVILKDVSDLKDETSYPDFQYKDSFTHLCNLIPNPQKEELKIEEVDITNTHTAGLFLVLWGQGSNLFTSKPGLWI